MSWYLDFSSFSTLERIIEGLISFYIMIMMLMGLKVIYKDRNQILNELDKAAFITATLNALCQIIYFLFILSTFFLMMIRAIRLIQDILVCTIFLIMLYPEKSPILKQIAYTSSFFSFILWLFGIIFIESPIDYDCSDYIWIIFSGINLILSSLNIYSGFNSYTSMKVRLYNQMNINLNEFEEKTPNNNFQEKTITNEDIINMRYSLTILMGSSFISIFIEFLWDYFLHIKSTDIQNCAHNYHSYSFGSFLFYLVLKGLCYWPSICGIYYVFYHRNKNNFNTMKESEERSLSIFFDFRSEYMDEETNDPDDFK